MPTSLRRAASASLTLSLQSNTGPLAMNGWPSGHTGPPDVPPKAAGRPRSTGSASRQLPPVALRLRPAGIGTFPTTLA
eukprot:10671090-Alexandrium_andersonii.AAC.1